MNEVIRQELMNLSVSVECEGSRVKVTLWYNNEKISTDEGWITIPNNNDQRNL